MDIVLTVFLMIGIVTVCAMGNKEKHVESK